MKKYFLVLVAVCLSSIAIAQTEGKPASPKESGLYILKSSVYRSALRYNDIQTATGALYEMILLDPQDVTLRDSLALLYFESRQYTSAVLMAQDILASNPENLLALEIGAVSYESLGLADKALANYEGLYLKRNNLFTLYKVATLQLQLKRLAEVKINADIILKDTKSAETKLVFNGENNKQQEVSMTAAAYNILGLVASEEGDKKSALKMYNKALEVQPDFFLVKNNIAELDK